MKKSLKLKLFFAFILFYIFTILTQIKFLFSQKFNGQSDKEPASQSPTNLWDYYDSDLTNCTKTGRSPIIMAHNVRIVPPHNWLQLLLQFIGLDPYGQSLTFAELLIDGVRGFKLVIIPELKNSTHTDASNSKIEIGHAHQKILDWIPNYFRRKLFEGNTLKGFFDTLKKELPKLAGIHKGENACLLL